MSVNRNKRKPGIEIVTLLVITIWPLTPLGSNYFSLDLRIAWQYKKFEFSIVGKDLLDTRHIEFGVAQIPRSIYGKIVCRI